jgi:Mn-dependent DtxR family transcriptional regulator
MEVKMDGKLEELTLMLLYLTSWQENAAGKKISLSWKGYPFDVLDKLTEEGYISGTKKAKSVYISEEGLKAAEKLLKKYAILK